MWAGAESVSTKPFVVMWLCALISIDVTMSVSSICKKTDERTVWESGCVECGVEEGVMVRMNASIKFLLGLYVIVKHSKHGRWQNWGIGEFSLSGIRETNLSRGIANRKNCRPQNELWGTKKAIEGAFKFWRSPQSRLRKWGKEAEGKVYGASL